eukprot:scaffold2130_cov402-Prasinococcus_capsulatus_cf.AAC.7
MGSPTRRYSVAYPARTTCKREIFANETPALQWRCAAASAVKKAGRWRRICRGQWRTNSASPATTSVPDCALRRSVLEGVRWDVPTSCAARRRSRRPGVAAGSPGDSPRRATLGHPGARSRQAGRQAGRRAGGGVPHTACACAHAPSARTRGCCRAAVRVAVRASRATAAGAANRISHAYRDRPRPMYMMYTASPPDLGETGTGASVHVDLRSSETEPAADGSEVRRQKVHEKRLLLLTHKGTSAVAWTSCAP